MNLTQEKLLQFYGESAVRIRILEEENRKLQSQQVNEVNQLKRQIDELKKIIEKPKDDNTGN